MSRDFLIGLICVLRCVVYAVCRRLFNVSTRFRVGLYMKSDRVDDAGCFYRPRKYIEKKLVYESHDFFGWRIYYCF